MGAFAPWPIGGLSLAGWSLGACGLYDAYALNALGFVWRDRNRIVVGSLLLHGSVTSLMSAEPPRAVARRVSLRIFGLAETGAGSEGGLPPCPPSQGLDG